MTTSPQAQIAVSPNYLADALHLPSGSEIVGCVFDHSRNVVLLHVAHAGLPERRPFEDLPEYAVHITRTSYKSEYKPR